MIRIFCFITLILIGRLCYLSEPYGVSVDESTYLSMAEVLNHGGVLYKDAVDRKPPGLFWLYEGIANLFGTWNIHGVHFVFLIILFGLIGMAGLIAFEIFGKWQSANLAMILFGLMSSCFPREILSANAEFPMLLCLSISLWCFLKFLKAENLSWLFVSVTFAVISTLFKQYGALIYVPMYLGWMWTSWRRGDEFWIPQLKALLVCFISILTVYGLTYFYFYSKNAEREFFYYFLSDGLKYIAESRTIANHATSPWGAIGGMLISWPVLWWGAARSYKYINEPVKRLVFLGALGAFLTIFLSGRYYTHYFIPAIWFLSLIATFGLDAIWPTKKNIILLAAFIPFSFYSIFNFEREAFIPTWSFTKERQMQMQSLSTFLNAQLRPEDRLVVWGMASQIYVMSKRGSGTRYIFADFVAGRQPGYKSEVSIPLPGAEESFLSDLEKNHPKVIIDTSSTHLNDYQWFPISRFPKINSYVKANYKLAAEVQGFTVWMSKTLQ